MFCFCGFCLKINIITIIILHYIAVSISLLLVNFAESINILKSMKYAIFFLITRGARGKCPPRPVKKGRSPLELRAFTLFKS